MLRIFALSLLLLTGFSNAEKLPLDYFTAMPMVDDPDVSPDGKHIAAIVNVNDQTQIMIAPFGSQKLTPLLSLENEKFRIEDVMWANNTRILVVASQPYNYEGMRWRTTHLFAANIDGSNVKELRRSARAKRSTSNSELAYYYNSPEVVSRLPKEPNHILVQTIDPRDNYYRSIYKVDINSGEHSKYLANGRRIVDWVVNSDGEVLVAVGVSGDPNDHAKFVYTRASNKENWKLVKRFEPYKTATFNPVFFDQETNSVLVLTDHQLYRTALWRFDLEKKDFTEVVAKAPGNYDIEDVIFHYKNGVQKLVGYKYADNFHRRVYFDHSIGQLDRQLGQALASSGLQSSIYSYDEANNKYIVKAVSDASPIKYFTFDAQSKKMSLWFSQHPNLEGKQLANVTPFSFNARDGMSINGYLTLPRGVEKPPVVLFPHGGPFARDYQYFDPFVQMIVNQGYAVLQVNYRGSTGFGNAYQVAGYKEWSKAMQTDLVDAMQWLKTTELVNTDKSCIAGASYGGYAALVAGYQTPEMFDCIASIAGISDLGDQITHWRRNGFRNYVDNSVGSDAESVAMASPINHIDKFKKPVLLVHGRVDTRVSYRQSTGMYDALKQAGKQVEYHELDFGTHFLNDASNRKHAMEQLSLFLQKHLN
jgi:dipeptidyl aminopeptidase/acylaminoacyl peptidase